MTYRLLHFATEPRMHVKTCGERRLSVIPRKSIETDQVMDIAHVGTTEGFLFRIRAPWAVTLTKAAQTAV